MAQEKYNLIPYQGSNITLFSDENDSYINLTELANAYHRRKSILTWIRSAKTIEFLNVWEKKHNPNYDGAQLSAVYKLVSDRALTIKKWIELTNSKGIQTRIGEHAGTYAHIDIAIRFAGWISPEFELYLVEEIQRLKKIEQKKNSFELLDHDQILALVRLKEVFKYVAHQEAAENAHKDVFASKSTSSNPFAEFNKWRGEILDISKQKINERIRQYCIDNNIAASKKMMNLSNREAILLLDSYDAVRNAVWDFLELKGEVNALNLANLAGNMIRIEQGQILRKNEDTLFDQKQELGEHNDFHKMIDNAPEVKTARQILEWRDKEIKRLKEQAVPPKEISKRIAQSIRSNTMLIEQKEEPLSDYNKKLQQALKYDPKKDKKE